MIFSISELFFFFQVDICAVIIYCTWWNSAFKHLLHSHSLLVNILLSGPHRNYVQCSIRYLMHKKILHLKSDDIRTAQLKWTFAISFCVVSKMCARSGTHQVTWVSHLRTLIRGRVRTLYYWKVTACVSYINSWSCCLNNNLLPFHSLNILWNKYDILLMNNGEYDGAEEIVTNVHESHHFLQFTLEVRDSALICLKLLILSCDRLLIISQNFST